MDARVGRVLRARAKNAVYFRRRVRVRPFSDSDAATTGWLVTVTVGGSKRVCAVACDRLCVCVFVPVQTFGYDNIMRVACGLNSYRIVERAAVVFLCLLAVGCKHIVNRIYGRRAAMAVL